ncbi:MAG: hypothetical protein ACOX9R_06680 [Armatimonadota bacterium]|jgi:hypothetical protein
MTGRTLSGVLALLLAVGVVWAQDDERVLLRYHWNPGEEIVWDVTSETTGAMIMRDLTKDPVEETVTSVWNRVVMPITLFVENVDEDGNATVTYQMGVMEMDVEAEGRQQYIRIDPQAGTMTVDGEPAPVPEQMLAGMAGSFRMVISPQGEMIDMDVPEGLRALMGASGMDMEQWMKLSQGWAASFPEEPIGIGRVWGASMTPPLPVEGDAEGALAPPGELTVLYRLLGSRVVNGVECAQIEMLGVMDFETLPTPGADAMPGVWGALDGVEMTIGPMNVSISGTIDFDSVGGRLIASDASVIMDMTQRVKGTIPAPEGAQDVEVDMEIITHDMKVNSRVEVAR